ncbi:unnamed protein product [Ciceribacter selenitireducens ATCC BAA-1503]|uniref:Uncharacterized protein n=1 Tax=Ciceribacter selenitireducens ATCC BAA-1503 TaxID=1336235 RepID=A0A376AJZ3_9HYPH|nr:unnamed protein product [Ciceribacter selenitireducens ATCC BAA-1503]
MMIALIEFLTTTLLSPRPATDKGPDGVIGTVYDRSQLRPSARVTRLCPSG